jgi:outer membrane lipoprotein SlyB
MTKILVAFLMAVTLFGCNNNSSNDVPASESEPTQEATQEATQEPAQEATTEDAPMDEVPADKSDSE